MAFKDIRVHVDNDAACGKRVEIAVNLATSIDAHLTGVHIRRAFPFPAYSVPTSPDMLEVYHEALDEKESKSRAIFDKVVGQNNAAVSWRSITGALSYELAADARYGDLLVLGQPDPKENLSLNGGITDEIILSAGRPCLVIPYQGAQVKFGDSPLIAWDGSQEASRAVHDALPFLKQAGKATVFIVEPEKADTAFGDLPGAMISEHLARHGIDVTIEVSRGSLQGTGDTILTYADAYGHDLIVMGAYGHARWREIVIGGATRTIMKNAKIPFLMSH